VPLLPAQIPAHYNADLDPKIDLNEDFKSNRDAKLIKLDLMKKEINVRHANGSLAEKNG